MGTNFWICANENGTGTALIFVVFKMAEWNMNVMYAMLSANCSFLNILNIKCPTRSDVNLMGLWSYCINSVTYNKMYWSIH